MSNLKVKILEATSNALGREMTVCPVLIYDEEKAVLIDSGLPGQFEILKSEVEKYIDINKLKALVITHHDIDHVGAARQFKELLGNDFKICSTDIEADYISGEKTPLKLVKLIENEANLDDAGKGRLMFFKKGFDSSYVKVDETFKAGDRLPIFNEVETLDMPGHTLGHICVYVRDQKTLITGDAVSLEDGKLIRIRDGANYDAEQAKNSLEELRGLDIEKVFCYHGGEYVGKVDVDELKK